MPYTNVEACIIKPHERYTPIVDYPTHVIIAHHRSYLQIAQEMAQDPTSGVTLDEEWTHGRNFRVMLTANGVPIVLDNTRDNAEETVTHTIKHYFRSTEDD